MSQMGKPFYDELYRREKNHWWFACRRRLASDALRRYRMKTPGRVLDMGCGTGAMLDELRDLGTAFGLDISPTALSYCAARGHTRLALGAGENLPYQAAAFDGIVSLDVIEHIEADRLVLQNLFRICHDGALVVITVPVTPWLWTTRDDRLLHKRRYTRPRLLGIARTAGFEIVKCSYYCVFFFPIVAAVVLLNRLLGRKPDVRDDIPSVNPLLNVILSVVLRAEQWLMRWVNYPFGVSLFCVLRKPVAFAASISKT
jgi:SAM-dependent methyltransferase